MTTHELISLCKRSDRRGQKMLYERFITKMTRLCWRYVKDEEDTKDVLAEAFIKIFQHIKYFDFHEEAGLEAWLKKIVVNQSLMFLRKNRNLVRTVNIEDNYLSVIAPVEIEMNAEDLYKLILELPLGYRTVFNLYVIEGYSHKEIAAQLTISESASRSQLTHARQRLMTLLSKNTKP